jgi:hypothetical protein
VTFYEDIAAVAVYPVMGDPMRMGMGWTIPAAGNPDVAGPIPAVVSVDPNVFASWGRAARFDDGGGRSYADHDLRK